jgi:hypothetical protein
MTGREDGAPIFPKPSTAVPLEIIAQNLKLSSLII